MWRKKAIFCLALTFISSILFSANINFSRGVWESDQLLDPLNIHKKLSEHGLYFMPTYVQDLDWPTRGGIKSSSYPLYLFLFDLQFGIDFEKLIHLKGNNFYLSFLVHEGKHPSKKYVGDFQGFDNLEAYPLIQISELWMQQSFFNDKCSITFGKIDAYNIFQYVEYAQAFINNSYTQIPTIIGFPTYPNTSVGVIVIGMIRDWFTIRTSIFDGSNAQGVRTGNLGAKLFFQNLGKHLLLMNEADFKWRTKKESFRGKAIFGVWGYNGALATFDNRTMGKAAGAYVCLNQTLWTQNLKRYKPSYLGAFSQWGYANPQLKISGAKFYLGGGLTYNNLVKKFDGDSLSLGAATVYFSRSIGSPFIKTYETSLELTYQMNIIPGVTVQPDIQWILNPGGNGNRNALVAILRLAFSI